MAVPFALRLEDVVADLVDVGAGTLQMSAQRSITASSSSSGTISPVVRERAPRAACSPPAQTVLARRSAR